ncbi:hypothetical protein RvY_12159 [Ramazzottius varieornatus]|uniref:Chromo domain-containing protein n=1 Tax=Ramazzottius varieornatus TaxID=947166 RepID=A0A1D1VSB9_RAMVA|nr:hypothetical protein RvY_12159 [Ramazzottius varieornatus]
MANINPPEEDEVGVRDAGPGRALRMKLRNNSTVVQCIPKRKRSEPLLKIALEAQNAVDAVVRKGMTTKAAAKLYSYSEQTLKNYLINAGFRPEKLAAVNQVVDRSMAIKTATKKSSRKAIGSSDPVELLSEPESANFAEYSKHGEECETDGIDDKSEIGRILDVRTKRQFLVKWQGETEDEAIWVDEDMFLGLADMTFK